MEKIENVVDKTPVIYEKPNLELLNNLKIKTPPSLDELAQVYSTLFSTFFLPVDETNTTVTGKPSTPGDSRQDPIPPITPASSKYQVITAIPYKQNDDNGIYERATDVNLAKQIKEENHYTVKNSLGHFDVFHIQKKTNGIITFSLRHGDRDYLMYYDPKEAGIIKFKNPKESFVDKLTQPNNKNNPSKIREKLIADWVKVQSDIITALTAHLTSLEKLMSSLRASYG